MNHIQLALIFAPQDMMLLFAIGFLLFGPQKLPEMGEALGKTMRAFREGSTKMMDELSRETRANHDNNQHHYSNYPQSMPMPAPPHVGELGAGHSSETPSAEVVHGELLHEETLTEVALNEEEEIHHGGG